MDFCLIFVPFGHYDEPEILPYENPSICPRGADVRHAGEREIKRALRKTLFKYKLHQDQELFERAYNYIRQYY